MPHVALDSKVELKFQKPYVAVVGSDLIIILLWPMIVGGGHLEETGSARAFLMPFPADPSFSSTSCYCRDSGYGNSALKVDVPRCLNLHSRYPTIAETNV